MIGLYFEDLEPGLVVELGSYDFTRENVLAFAHRFDPQPFHVDDEAARHSPFGKLAASGWHTASAWMKCFVATNARLAATRPTPVPVPGPSPGFTALKWLSPVYPGDTVAFAIEVTAKRELASKPGWGLVSTVNGGRNQDGRLVFAFEGRVFVQRRQAGKPLV